MRHNEVRLNAMLYHRTSANYGKVKAIVRIGPHTKFLMEWVDGTFSEEVALNLLKTKPGDNPRIDNRKFFPPEK